MARRALVVSDRLHFVLLPRRHVVKVHVVDARPAAVRRRLVVESDRRGRLAPFLDRTHFERRLRQQVEVLLDVRVDRIDVGLRLVEVGLLPFRRVREEVLGSVRR